VRHIRRARHREDGEPLAQPAQNASRHFGFWTGSVLETNRNHTDDTTG
jgi:hypothetical protein